MSKSSKRRNRLGVFLAVLSLATTAKSNFASAASYSNSQTVGAVVSDIEWGSILDRYGDLNQAKSAVSSFADHLKAFRQYAATIRNHAKSFETKLAEEHMDRPGFFARFTGSSAIGLAADSIEQKANAAYMSFKGYCDNIGLSGNDVVGLVPSLKSLLKDLDAKFPGIYSTDRVKILYDNMYLNLLDIRSLYETLPDEVGKAKDSSGMDRYDRYDDILTRLNKDALRWIKEAISKIDAIEEIENKFANEISHLPEKVAEINANKERKQREEQDRIERETQEKLENEKKAAEEQKRKALEEAKRNEEEAKRKFFDEKSKWQNEFAEILEHVDKGFESICTNSDPDVGELVKKDQGNLVAEFKSNLESEIEILNDMKEYNEVNLQKVMDMRSKSLDIKEHRRKLERSIKEHKGDLIREKKELESLKNEIVISVGRLGPDLSLTWNEEIGKLVSDGDKERFTNMAKPSFETAKKIIEQMVQEVSQVKVDLTRNSRSDLESLNERIQDRKNKVLRSIELIRSKGLSIRIVGMKDSISDMFKERDKLWTGFKNKYEPSRLTDDLRNKTSNIWKSIEGLYNEELEWSESIDKVLKSKDVSESTAERLDGIITDLSGRLGVWRNNLKDHELGMQEFLDKIRMSEERKLSFKRIFSTEGSFDLVKKDTGDASVNATAADSAKIADVIDNFLPGTREVIRVYADSARTGGYQCVLTSGRPGWGKTQGVKYFASAINAKIVPVDYNELEKGDGAKYADSLLRLSDGDDQPWILLMHEFDTVSRKVETGKTRAQSSAVVNSFLNKVKEIMEDSNTNLKLVVCLSNENKDKLDSANFSRMTKYLVLGNNPNYKRIVSTICSGVRCATSEVSKDDFINKISRHCDALLLKGKELSARTINQSVLDVAREWCDNINKNKAKNDPEYVDLYDAQISSDEVCKKLSIMAGND